MKTTLLLIGALSADAISCGQWYSNPCLAEDDARYDPSGSDSIIDQAPVAWGNFEGFWRYEVKAYGPDGQPQEPTITNPNQPFLVGGFPYPYFPAFGFLNVTISGSRMYQHRYLIHPPASADFCDQAVIPGFVNVLDNGDCGKTGYSYFSEIFATSSFERDGTVVTLPNDSNLGSGGLLRSSQTYTSRPIDNRTIYSVAKDGTNGGLLSETIVFLNADNTRLSGISEFFISLRNEARLAAFFRTDYSRLESADAFAAALETAYEANNVPLENRVQSGVVPMETQCLAETCPTEEAWCTIDPGCGVTPYQEAEGSVKAGMVAGMTVGVAALLIFALYLVHLYRLKRQQKRYRADFAKRVADAIEVQESTYALESDKLLKEFHQLDPALREGASGKICKEEMKEFLQSGVVGYITESDFGALFSAIDTDHSGYVDFLEFCAFMAQCHDEFEKEHVSREALAKTIARQLAKLSMHDISVRSTSLAAGMVMDAPTREIPRDCPTSIHHSPTSILDSTRDILTLNDSPTGSANTPCTPKSIRSARSMGSGAFFS
mmetsp:Transcript_25103/g.41664  ORF Transcript_25103/g.41664 Transcript_25103/m.41664 type:complete len:549 (-) Transcript_25103:969-2615(-)